MKYVLTITLVWLVALAGGGCSSRTAAPASVNGSDGSEPLPATGGLTRATPSAKTAPAASKEVDTQPAAGGKEKDEAAPKPAAAPPAEAERASKVDPEVLSSIAAGFQSRYSIGAFTAAEQFRQLPPDVRRDALAKLSAYDSSSVRANSWRAFATWATRDDVPTLMAALQSPHEDVRIAALELLARFPGDATIGVLTKTLENPDFRERAEALLVRVGPAAEGALLNYVNHTDAALRSASWRILGKIGSRKSLLALEQLATQEQFQKDAELKQVLAEIRERLRK